MTTIVKVESIMIGASIVGFFALALIGRWLRVRGTVPEDSSLARVTFAPLMGLFVLFAFGLIGLGLHFFIVGQGTIGNGEVTPVSFLRRSEAGVTLGLWAFLLVGFLIAYPFMHRDMLQDSKTATPPSQTQLQSPDEQKQ